MTKKGNTNNPNGRPKGRQNRHTTRFKSAIHNMLEEASDDMLLWLSQIEDPKKRFDVLKDFCEYLYPKLARVEQESKQTLVDKNGKEILKEDLEILKNSGLINIDDENDKPITYN